ncbi:hypothetical protein [Streptomyces sp. G45]
MRAELKKRNRKAANHRVAAILDALKADSDAVRILQGATSH